MHQNKLKTIIQSFDNTSKTHFPYTTLTPIDFETTDQYRPASLCSIDKAAGWQLIGQYPEGLRDIMQNRHTGVRIETPIRETHYIHLLG